MATSLKSIVCTKKAPAAMQRVEKNINELQGKLGREFNMLRQSAIDEEPFDVISGYE